MSKEIESIVPPEDRRELAAISEKVIDEFHFAERQQAIQDCARGIATQLRIESKSPAKVITRNALSVFGKNPKSILLPLMFRNREYGQLALTDCGGEHFKAVVQIINNSRLEFGRIPYSEDESFDFVKVSDKLLPNNIAVWSKEELHDVSVCYAIFEHDVIMGDRVYPY